MSAAPILQEYPNAQATHSTQLGSTLVHWQLVRSAARRSIELSIPKRGAGLLIRAPAHAPLAHIEAVLRDKSRWVLEKLHESQLFTDRTPRIHWAHGARLPWLGQTLHLHLHPGAPRQGELLRLNDTHSVLHLGADPLAAPAQVRALLLAWWLRQARAHFVQRLNAFAPALQVRWTRLRLSDARTRWGSAKSDGSIMLRWRLLHFSPEIVDYVVIHELCHLRHMDHSPRFWALVETLCPNWKTLRQSLNTLPIPQWEL